MEDPFWFSKLVTYTNESYEFFCTIILKNAHSVQVFAKEINTFTILMALEIEKLSLESQDGPKTC